MLVVDVGRPEVVGVRLTVVEVVDPTVEGGPVTRVVLVVGVVEVVVLGDPPDAVGIVVVAAETPPLPPAGVGACDGSVVPLAATAPRLTATVDAVLATVDAGTLGGDEVEVVGVAARTTGCAGPLVRAGPEGCSPGSTPRSPRGPASELLRCGSEKKWDPAWALSSGPVKSTMPATAADATRPLTARCGRY